MIDSTSLLFSLSLSLLCDHLPRQQQYILSSKWDNGGRSLLDSSLGVCTILYIRLHPLASTWNRIYIIFFLFLLIHFRHCFLYDCTCTCTACTRVYTDIPNYTHKSHTLPCIYIVLLVNSLTNGIIYYYSTDLISMRNQQS